MRAIRLPALVTVAATALCVSSARAADLTFVWTGAESAATLRAERVDGEADVVERAVTLPGTVTLPLDGGLWNIRLIADGSWAAPTVIRSTDTVMMRLWPTATVAVQANVPSLRAQFKALRAGGPSGDVDCSPDGKGMWSCAIPQGPHDLRFASPGYAPEFRFGMNIVGVENGDADVLYLRFVVGASLTGSVTTARDVGGSVDAAEVSLTPRKGRAYQAKANHKGFFQFKGLSAGEYVLRCKKDGLVTEARPIKILAGLAADLSSPMVLDAPKRLTVNISPPLAPDDSPWQVSLNTIDSRLGRQEAVSESLASLAGEWSLAGLISGEYVVRIRGGSGELWKSETIVISDHDVNLALSAVAEQITGRITLNGRPLAASLSFGGEGHPSLHSDDNGDFKGEIPPGDAERVIVIQASIPTVQRTIRTTIEQTENGRRLIIDLPGTTLMGRIIDEEGSPAAHAILTVTRDEPDVFEQVTSERDGTFQLAGLDPGSYKAIAAVFQKESTPVSVEVTADAPAEVEIVVRREVRVRGRMTIGNTPVVHAAISALPRDTWRPTGAPEFTNERGEFALRFPPGTTTYDVLASHPAFDVVLGRAMVRKDKVLQINVRQIGGTLIVESKSPTDLRLRHDGADLQLTWVAEEADGTIAPDRVTVPRLEAGHYEICSLQGARCVSGFVPPHGTLTLSLN